MNIAIPILDIENNSNTIAPSLNVNGYICLYDNEKEVQMLIRTLDLAQDMGQLLPALEQKSVSTIITEQIHPMALKVLVNKGFTVFRSKGKHLEENLMLFNRNELIPFDMNAAMDFAESCGGACSTCTTPTDCSDEKKQKDIL